MIKNIKERARHLRGTVVRFWNWRQKPESSKLGVTEPVSQRFSIESLPDSDIIKLAQVDFPATGLSPKQRRIYNKRFIGCNFSHRTIKNLTFNGCSFKGCSFNGASIIEVEFHKCAFSECYFYKTKFSSTYLDPRTLSFSDDWHWDRANVNTWLFQALYRNSKDMHQEEFAMHADIRFQFYMRYQYLRAKKPNLRKFASNLLYGFLLGYGYGIKNALLATLAIILTFTYLIDGRMGKDGTNFLEAFYFSVVSFTTVGYGDLTPAHEILPLFITGTFLLISVGWCAVVTAIIVKRIVK